MPYLIDGHNLIPKLGLKLDSIDDEMELVAILQEYVRLERRQMEIYFDGAPKPQAGIRKLGTITAHFVPLGMTADNAIRNRLKKLGKAAKNWIVVSSDRQVQADARALHVQVISSDLFSKGLKEMMNSSSVPKSERMVSKTEIDEWLKIFDKEKK